MVWKFPFDRPRLDIFELLIVVLARRVARVLSTGQEHEGHDAACPEVHFLRVSFLRRLLWCHVDGRASPLAVLQPPVLLGAETEVDNLHCAAVFSRVGQEYVGRLQISVDYVARVHVSDPFEQTLHDFARLQVRQRPGFASLVFESEKSLELAASDQLHLDDYEFLIFKDAF